MTCYLCHKIRTSRNVKFKKPIIPWFKHFYVKGSATIDWITISTFSKYIQSKGLKSEITKTLQMLISDFFLRGNLSMIVPNMHVCHHREKFLLCHRTILMDGQEGKERKSITWRLTFNLESISKIFVKSKRKDGEETSACLKVFRNRWKKIYKSSGNSSKL